MGCSSSRKEEESSSDTSAQCNDLMLENLENLAIIGYLFLKSDSKAAALITMNITKRTEDFYKILAQCRQYWIIKSRNEYTKTLKYSYITDCELEKRREKEKLLATRNKLEKCIEKFIPGWKNKYSQSNKLKQELEDNENLVHNMTELYLNHYSSNKKDISFYINEMQFKLTQDEIKIISDIKSVTIKVYKMMGGRAFYGSTIDSVTVSMPEVKEDEQILDNLYTEDIRYSISQK